MIYYICDTDFSVRKIEQVGPIMYMQVILKFQDMNVNNIEYSNYYIITEFFMITRADGSIFAISTFLPTGNPAAGNEAGVAINEWLTSFRLVAF